MRIGTWLWVVREWFLGDPELHVLSLFLKRSGVFVDAGANVGIYSLTAGRSTDTVIAFEPNPDLASVLRVLLRSGDRVRQVAVSDQGGIATLDIPEHDGTEQHTRGSLTDHHAQTSTHASASDSTRSLTVRTSALDDEDLGDVQLIKIDVEGHENSVLRGGTRTIHTHRPVVLIEAEERHRLGTIAEMESFFNDRDYCGWFLLRGKVLPFARFEIRTHQAADTGPRYRERVSPDYVNNFIWIPRERDDLVESLQRFTAGRRLRSVASLIRGTKV